MAPSSVACPGPYQPLPCCPGPLQYPAGCPGLVSTRKHSGHPLTKDASLGWVQLSTMGRTRAFECRQRLVQPVAGSRHPSEPEPSGRTWRGLGKVSYTSHLHFSDPGHGRLRPCRCLGFQVDKTAHRPAARSVGGLAIPGASRCGASFEPVPMAPLVEGDIGITNLCPLSSACAPVSTGREGQPETGPQIPGQVCSQNRTFQTEPETSEIRDRTPFQGVLGWWDPFQETKLPSCQACGCAGARWCPSGLGLCPPLRGLSLLPGAVETKRGSPRGAGTWFPP